MTDKRQKAAKVKYKCDESLTKQSIFEEYSLLQNLEAFDFFWRSFADEHNTLLKLTMRNVKLNKFAFVTPWLPDLLCKHWFTSSVWNFCRWVADVPPRKPSPSGNDDSQKNSGHFMTPSLVFLWMTSGEQLQKFHTNQVLGSGLCFWLLEANFPHATTNQKHSPDQGSDLSPVWNFCTHDVS